MYPTSFVSASDLLIIIYFFRYGKKRSDMWYHFSTIDNTKKAKCRYCKSIISVSGGSVGNLSRHFKLKHPTVPLSRITVNVDQSSNPRPQSEPGRKVSSFSSPVSFNPSNPVISIPDTYVGEIINENLLSEPSTSNTPVPFKHNSTRQSTITSFIDIVKPVPIRKSILIDEQLVKMICKEFHPFSLVEDVEFQKFVNLLNPEYQLPSRKTVSNSLIPRVYEETKSNAKIRFCFGYLPDN